MENTLKLQGKYYKVEWNVLAMMIFKRITGREFIGDSTEDNYVMLYCLLMSSNDDVLSFDEYLKEVSKSMKPLKVFTKVMKDAEALMLKDDEDNEEEYSKKN